MDCYVERSVALSEVSKYFLNVNTGLTLVTFRRLAVFCRVLPGQLFISFLGQAIGLLGR